VFVGAGDISTLELRCGASFWIKKTLILGLRFFHLQQPLEKKYIRDNADAESKGKCIGFELPVDET